MAVQSANEWVFVGVKFHPEIPGVISSYLYLAGIGAHLVVVDGSIGTKRPKTFGFSAGSGQAGSGGAQIFKLSRSSGMRFTEGCTFKREKGGLIKGLLTVGFS